MKTVQQKQKEALREIAERRIEETRTGNPLADTITANKIWGDYLRCAGIH